MTDDADSILWGPIHALRAITAASETFQTLVVADDAEEAAAHVFCPAIPGGDYKAARPFVLIDLAPEWEAEALAAGVFRAAGGRLFWAIEADVPAEHAGETAAKLEAAHKWFLKLAADILGEILVASKAEGALAVQSVRLVEGPHRAAKETRKAEGDYCVAAFALSWESGAF